MTYLNVNLVSLEKYWYIEEVSIYKTPTSLVISEEMLSNTTESILLQYVIKLNGSMITYGKSVPRLSYYVQIKQGVTCIQISPMQHMSLEEPLTKEDTEAILKVLGTYTRTALNLNLHLMQI